MHKANKNRDFIHLFVKLSVFILNQRLHRNCIKTDIKWMNDRGMVLSRMKLHLFMTHCCVDGLGAQPMEIDGVIELHSKVNRTDRIVAVYSKYTIQIEKKKQRMKNVFSRLLWTGNMAVSSHIGHIGLHQYIKFFFPPFGFCYEPLWAPSVKHQNGYVD